MAYTIPWDESTPDGSITAASDIDSELQDLKTSMRERLEQVIPDFGDDGVDPKVIPTAIAYFMGHSITQLVLTASNQPITGINDRASSSGDFTNGGDEVTLDKGGTYFFMGTFNVGTLDNPIVTLNISLIGGGIANYNQTVWAPKAVGGDETSIGLQGLIVADPADVLSIQCKNNNAPGDLATINSCFFSLIELGVA